MQIQASEGSVAAACATLSQSVQPSYRPKFCLLTSGAFLQYHLHCYYLPILLGWFSSAGARNIRVAADRIRVLLYREFHSSLQAFLTRDSSLPIPLMHALLTNLAPEPLAFSLGSCCCLMQ